MYINEKKINKKEKIMGMVIHVLISIYEYYTEYSRTILRSVH